MVRLIKGNNDAFSCNGYLIGSIAIDAPVNSKAPEAELLIVTHPHCDHFVGAVNYPFKKAASISAKNAINSKDDQLCLCSYVERKFPSVKIDYSLKDGEIIEKNGVKLEVIYTPGHCEGSLCLYEPNRKILFSGDTLFPGYNSPRTDLPSGNKEKLKESYEKLANLKINTIYPGHGEIIREKEYIKNLLRLF